MSECVVRMEMPENCFNCDLRYECNAFYAPGKPKPFMKGCRIVCQLPEGHGLLVDADAIKLPKGFFEKVDNVPKFYEWLNSLPTIVPADEKRRAE